MKRRNFLQYVGSLPFLGFLKVKPETDIQREELKRLQESKTHFWCLTTDTPCTLEGILEGKWKELIHVEYGGFYNIPIPKYNNIKAFRVCYMNLKGNVKSRIV